jgi:hypothetical protein
MGQKRARLRGKKKKGLINLKRAQANEFTTKSNAPA